MRAQRPRRAGVCRVCRYFAAVEKIPLFPRNAARPLHTLHRPVTTRLPRQSLSVLLGLRTRKERIS